MDAAAKAGDLDIVRFLHENRTEGCTAYAMRHAARGGHLDVVKFLNENRTEGCVEDGLSWPAQFECVQGDSSTDPLEIVEYLAKHRPEAIGDPTPWHLNDGVKILQSAWANTAAASGDPAQALSAAVIELTDLEAFKAVHEQKHPAGCPSVRADDRHWSDDKSLLRLAIDIEKDDFTIYLVKNCECVGASVGYYELRAACSEWRSLSLELLDLLMEKRPRNERTQRSYDLLIRRAAKASHLPVVKALLERDVPCTEEVLMEGLYGDSMEVPDYLMQEYPELINMDVMKQIAYRCEYEYLYKLCESHPHLYDSSIVDEILCGELVGTNPTWDVLATVLEKCPAVPLSEETLKAVWQNGTSDVRVFLWLVWRDPKIATTFAQAERVDQLRLYSQVREAVPSVFEGVPTHWPWCCQLRFLRELVEFGDLTVE